jgi:putative transposase
MQRKIVISLDEFYHIYNRGVEKRNIFLKKSDYQRFIKLLYVANGTAPYRFEKIKNTPLNQIDRGSPLVAIGAYVLMPNHFHILVKEITEGGISKFMEKLTTGYSSYFNIINERVGSLFQGTYKAEHADTDEYLKYLFSYIHLNPIKLIDGKWKEKGIKDLNKTKKFLLSYDYSSYQDYLGMKREKNLILTKEAFPEYFKDEFEFKDFVDNWIDYNNE